MKQTNYESNQTDVLPSFEVGNTQYVNLSGEPKEKALSYLPKDLNAERVVFLPALCPGRSPLPTGCAVELNPAKQPEWRKFAISDVGCGMTVLSSDLKWEDFEANLALWDELALRLKANRNQGLGDLGSGNHFLDAVLDSEEGVHFVIHTGSRDESRKVSALVRDPKAFDRQFAATATWARDNRLAVAQLVSNVYAGANVAVSMDKSHNQFEALSTGHIVIRKGAVHLKEGDLTLIPSNMDGEMVLVEATKYDSSILESMSHGTGRVMSRAQAKEVAEAYDYNALRTRIHIPPMITDASIKTEAPFCYRNLDDCLDLLGPTVQEVKRFWPIAYIGQL